ncbi:MAG: alpha-mannosidase [Thermoleophilia bacterium]|nr:alpha-mannosidase [Thermoleophilia bacterium]
MIGQATPVMRRLALCSLLVLVVPATARAGVRVSAFYYPWYGTSTRDGAFQHWAQRGHAPPNDIASAYYPSRGLYSSSDRLVTGAQMDDMRAAGIDEVAVSWWGQGSPEDGRLAEVVAAARTDGLAVAVHLEPYDGRTVASTVADVAYLRSTFGIRIFYVYRPLDLPVADWAAAAAVLHEGGSTLFAQTALVGAAAAAGFDGVYTYDIVVYGGGKFARICSEARAVKLLCAPSVGPGYDARRGSGDPVVKPRRNGATYDSMWKMAITARADRVTITSYNEWHEGTQIEPASSGPRWRGRYRYLSYDGAWGLHGVAAERAYLTRTRYWADVFRSTSLLQLKTKAS